MLIHSPVLHPGVWDLVAAELRPDHEVLLPSLTMALAGPSPYWRQQAALAAETALGADGPSILVGHSGSGPLLALIGRQLTQPVTGYLFVDAGLPTGGSWFAHAPAELVDHLRALARDEWLPRWTDWWEASDLAAELPDERQREDLAASLAPLPLAMFEETLPAVEGWPDAPCGYLRLSSGYDQEAAEAASLGWPVEVMQSTHLGILTEPTAVTDRIRALLSKLELA
jgi:hypothetical protein